MAIRSIASLSLTFGLVSIPVKVYLATESSAAIKFKLMAASGARLRQQYVEDAAAVEAGSPAEADQEDPPEFEEAAARGSTVTPLPSRRAHMMAPVVEDHHIEPQVIERVELSE